MLVQVQPRGTIVKFHRKSVFPNKTNASRSTLSMAEVKYSPRAVLMSSLVEAQKILSVEKPLALISLVISPVAMTKTTVTQAQPYLSAVSYSWHAHRRHWCFSWNFDITAQLHVQVLGIFVFRWWSWVNLKKKKKKRFVLYNNYLRLITYDF